MKQVAVLGLVCGLVCMQGEAAVLQRPTSESAAAAGDYDWDYLLFVQQWPASVCVGGHMANNDNCAFPQGLSSQDWTMHGLWPNKLNTVGPNGCNKTATWSVDALYPIMNDLKSFWPNLETDKPFVSFWQHEWFKHGTCAQSLPALQGEFNYFNVPLQLRKKFNLYETLQNQNIAPSTTKTFSHDQISEALQKAFGERIEVYCAVSGDTKMHYVSEIRICLDKTFKLIQCPTTTGQTASETSSCPKQMELRYPPIQTPTPKPMLPRP